MIYVLCIKPPLAHAAHYVGFCEDDDPTERVNRHLAGAGSPLIRAAVKRGHQVVLVASFPGDRTLERRLKRMGGHGPRLCLDCRPTHLAKRRAAQAR